MSDNGPKKPYKTLALTTTVVSYLVGPLLVGLFGGRWIDGYLKTSPIFLIVGMLLGLAAGVYGLIRVLKEILGEDNNE